MSRLAHNPAIHRSLSPGRALAAALLLLCVPSLAAAQNPGLAPPPPSAVPHEPPPPVTPPLPSSSAATQIDRVVAIVNGDLILESDVDEERRFAAFQPYSNPTGAFSRPDAINRLINRALILQQNGEQSLPPIPDDELTADIADLRKAIFACRVYKCETDAGWHSFLTANGFTEEEFRQRWHDRMVTLRFIEQRFRMGIRIEPSEIDDYYRKTLLPEYASRHVSPPPVDRIRDRIQEILLQEQVGKLLDDWLQALRASGDVQMVRPGEVTP
jgi:peptidyl-prolyl cis-trans isomerase SurA